MILNPHLTNYSSAALPAPPTMPKSKTENCEFYYIPTCQIISDIFLSFPMHFQPSSPDSDNPRTSRRRTTFWAARAIAATPPATLAALRSVSAPSVVPAPAGDRNDRGANDRGPKLGQSAKRGCCHLRPTSATPQK